jgi:signal peptidase I
MMHCTNGAPGDPARQLGKDCAPESWGRIGTIDPGDLVFVRKVWQADEVETKAGAGAGHYGGPGDVIVFHPNGNRGDTPVIHRALFWVQVNGDGTLSVPAFGLDHVRRIDAREAMQMAGCDVAGAFAAQPSDPVGIPPAERSGFVTRGDNNGIADQCSAMMPARLPWVIGKARGEVPWVGLVNLLWSDITAGSANFGNAGADSKVMFFVVVAVVVVSPWGIEWLVHRRRLRRHGAAEGTGDGKADDDGADADGHLRPPGSGPG